MHSVPICFMVCCQFRHNFQATVPKRVVMSFDGYKLRGSVNDNERVVTVQGTGETCMHLITVLLRMHLITVLFQKHTSPSQNLIVFDLTITTRQHI